MKTKFDHKSFNMLLGGLNIRDLKRIREAVHKKIKESDKTSFSLPRRRDRWIKLPSNKAWKRMSGNQRSMCFYKIIMNDNWSSIYSPEKFNDVDKDYYVYIHIDPNKNQRFVCEPYLNISLPFYIGKGKGDRLYSTMRSKSHKNKLNQLLEKDSIESIALKIEDKLTERDALELEAKLILFFGCISADKKLKSFFCTPCLFNRQYEPFPDRYSSYKFMASSYSDQSIKSIKESNDGTP